MKWAPKRSEEKFNGFLDYGTAFTGELTFQGTFRIDGEFHGSITTPDVLIVGPQAAVHADIKAGVVKILGSVYGNIESARRVEISSTGRVQGDVRTSRLIIEEGATFDGHSHTDLEPERVEPSSEATIVGSNRPEPSKQPESSSLPERSIQPHRRGETDGQQKPVKKNKWQDGFLP